MSWSFFERGDYEQSDPSKWNKSFPGLINIFLVSTNYEKNENSYNALPYWSGLLGKIEDIFFKWI